MDNYRPLPEWHPQDACLIVWPHSYSDWLPRLNQASDVYINITRIISDNQKVIIAHFDVSHKTHIEKLCAKGHCNLTNIYFVEIKTNDTWVRDFGPQFLSANRRFRYLNMEFNAWGYQYDYELDNQFSQQLFQIINHSITEHADVSVVIEGGNLDFNSHGTLLTNFTSIRKNNPHKHYPDKFLTEQLTGTFELDQVIGLNVDGLDGDDTHGHIDTLARFITDDLIVYASTENPHHPDYSRLANLKTQLNDYLGRQCQLLPIMLPEKTIKDEDGQILPASYLNFVFINESLLVPIYNDENDDYAISTFKQLCPDREVVGINACELIKQSGSLHCATLNLPKNSIDENWYRPTK